MGLATGEPAMTSKLSFWSMRDRDAIAVEELIFALKDALQEAGDDLERRWDVSITFLHGWDTWALGIPGPISDLFQYVIRKPVDRLIPGNNKKKCSC